ncbi:hypothetical protein CLOP_g16259 [Closterium sp. NIES-67]|nr:hypothetical protein CLOP_g16259 [Closterium sp. NIES-67]
MIFPDDLPSGLPPEQPQDHKIELELGAQPTIRTQWRLTQPELYELRNQLDYLLAKGFIRPSTSPFAAPILFTPKKGGGLRMCTDYCALNRVTIKSRYPIPCTDELIDNLREARYFSKIDLRGGYHQIRVFVGDCHKTVFRTRYGTHHEQGVSRSTRQMCDNLPGRHPDLQQDPGATFKRLGSGFLAAGEASSHHQGLQVRVFKTINGVPGARDLPGGNSNGPEKTLGYSGVETANKSAAAAIISGCRGVYYLRSGTDRIWVPSYRLLRELLIQEVHDSNLSGHFGVDKTLKELQRFYYWPDMVPDVQRYVAACPICQRMKSLYQRPAGLLQPLEPPQRPWQHVMMDFVTGLPAESRENDAVLVVVDQLKKMAHFAPCRTTLTAEETA